MGCATEKAPRVANCDSRKLQRIRLSAVAPSAAYHRYVISVFERSLFWTGLQQPDLRRKRPKSGLTLF